jgi:antitoxin ParD1/3/4
MIILGVVTNPPHTFWYDYFILYDKIKKKEELMTMPTTEKRTVSLPPEHAAFVDRLVASGDYASVSEVVRAGLRALQERDAAVEKWLHEEVAPTFDAMHADPRRGLDAQSVFANVRAHHAARLKGEA